MRLKEIREMMCDEGWPHYKGHKGMVSGPPNPLACAECESMFLGGVEYLKYIPDEEFRALLCGGDCANCRQPCNLRRLALMRKIKPRVVRKRKNEKRKTWLGIAMRPYDERHAFDKK